MATQPYLYITNTDLSTIYGYNVDQEQQAWVTRAIAQSCERVNTITGNTIESFGFNNLNSLQKENIKRASAKLTIHFLEGGLDWLRGSTSVNAGSVSMSQSNPDLPDYIMRDVYDLLQVAGLYRPRDWYTKDCPNNTNDCSTSCSSTEEIIYGSGAQWIDWNSANATFLKPTTITSSNNSIEITDTSIIGNKAQLDIKLNESQDVPSYNEMLKSGQPISSLVFTIEVQDSFDVADYYVIHFENSNDPNQILPYNTNSLIFDGNSQSCIITSLGFSDLLGDIVGVYDSNTKTITCTLSGFGAYPFANWEPISLIRDSAIVTNRLFQKFQNSYNNYGPIITSLQNQIDSLSGLINTTGAFFVSDYTNAITINSTFSNIPIGANPKGIEIKTDLLNLYNETNQRIIITQELLDSSLSQYTAQLFAEGNANNQQITFELVAFKSNGTDSEIIDTSTISVDNSEIISIILNALNPTQLDPSFLNGWIIARAKTNTQNAFITRLKISSNQNVNVATNKTRWFIRAATVSNPTIQTLKYEWTLPSDFKIDLTKRYRVNYIMLIREIGLLSDGGNKFFYLLLKNMDYVQINNPTTAEVSATIEEVDSGTILGNEYSLQFQNNTLQFNSTTAPTTIALSFGVGSGFTLDKSSSNMGIEIELTGTDAD